MNLFDAATEGSDAEYASCAIAWLETKIGFDGLVWGSGTRLQDGGFFISKYYLEGRAPQLVSDYPASSELDPVLKAFLDEPARLQTVATNTFYDTGRLQEMRDYLEHYEIRHLQLIGCRDPYNGTYEWMVFYRSDHQRPFQPGLADMTANMALLALQGMRCQRAVAACAGVTNGFQPPHPGHVSPETALTVRQAQVLHLLAQGWSNKMIARHLHITDNTLKSHLAVVFRVLGVHSRAQAAIAVAEQHGLLGRTPKITDALADANPSTGN